jgi:acyl carrier protein
VKQETSAILNEIISAVIGTPGSDARVGDKTGDEWDSLAHVEILYTLEQEFGVRLTSEQMSCDKNRSAVLEMINQATERTPGCRPLG